MDFLLPWSLVFLEFALGPGFESNEWVDLDELKF